MKRFLWTTILVSLFSISLKGQTYFDTDFESDTNIWYLGSAVCPLKDSTGYVAVGNMPKGGGPNYTSFLRLNNLGDTLFTKTISKYNFHQTALGRLISIGDTQFVFTGYSLPDSMPTAQDSSYIKLVKVDITGNIIWEKEYGDDGKQNVGYDIQQTVDKGFIISGYTDGWGTVNSYNSFLLKVDSLGNEEWHQKYGGGNRDAYSVDTTTDGGYVIAGSLYSPVSDIDINVVKTDSLGNMVWSQVYGTIEEDNNKAFVTNYNGTNDYILTGAIDLLAGIQVDFQAYIARISGTNGNVIWADTIGINSPNQLEGFSSNSIILKSGDIISIMSIDPDSNSATHATIIKHDSNGNLLWSRTFNKYGGSINQNYFWDVQATYDGGFILCGDLTKTFPSFSQNIWFVKLDSMGCEVINCSVGVEEVTTSLNITGVNVYPNPTSTSITIELPITNGEIKTQLLLFDITGKAVFIKQINTNITQIDISHFPKGMYFYQVIGEKENYSGKLIITH